MSLEIDASALRAVQQQISTAPARIERRVNGRSVTAIRALLNIARRVVHVQSHRLQNSLYIDGPFPTATGTLEAAVKSPLSYADSEVAHGGEHDYPARTIQQAQGELDELARDLELIVIEETGAGRA